MRISIPVAAITVLAILSSSAIVSAQKQFPLSPRILSAKTVYLDNKTGHDAVGCQRSSPTKKVGEISNCHGPQKAEVALLLSTDAYHDGELIYSGGQTGHIDSSGNVAEDRVPKYSLCSDTQNAFLTVIDPVTGKNLWTASHVWGGLLTGVNSAGARLVKELQNQIKK